MRQLGTSELSYRTNATHITDAPFDVFPTFEGYGISITLHDIDNHGRSDSAPDNHSSEEPC